MNKLDTKPNAEDFLLHKLNETQPDTNHPPTPEQVIQWMGEFASINVEEALNNKETSGIISVSFTEDEIMLLQSILVCMNESNDWDFKKGNGLMHSRVLLDRDVSVPEQINRIYEKLF
jgi:hypothetical protein